MVWNVDDNNWKDKKIWIWVFPKNILLSSLPKQKTGNKWNIHQKDIFHFPNEKGNENGSNRCEGIKNF